ncbi:flagellar export protein FliJ [Thermodesulforhabdus norvegica]|uniref:Flagellar FliJ protein n=1 Tax=Thermodesulforhabdus norvegica TaxID=39841 RepID=A0A1I4R6X6_9BACT|nr:flagellar export protein FliJ [Thermodesulforhabdus norvegica]SFM47700.1 FliJ protein [Thermodesulforhabdus norvegica]
MAFRFRFEQLLHYRRHLLERVEQDFGRALEKVRKVQSEVDRIESQKKLCQDLLYEKQCEGLPAVEHELLVKNLYGLELKARQTRKRLEEAIKEMEEQRERLIEAKKRLEMLEILKRQEVQEYRRDQTKKEQKLADEIAVQKTVKEP